LKRIVLITLILFFPHFSFNSQYNATQTNNSSIVPFAAVGYQLAVNGNPLSNFGTYTRNNTIHVGNSTINRKARRQQQHNKQGTSSAEQLTDKHVDALNTYINEECLGVDNNHLFGRMNAYIVAKYTVFQMHNDAALLALEDCLLFKHKSFDIQKLRARNTYFDELMHKAQQEVTERFGYVDGINIDMLLYQVTSLPDTINKYLSEKPLQEYADFFNIDKSLSEINMGDYRLSDFKMTNLILFQKELIGDIQSLYMRPVCLSTDQLYIKGTDNNGKELVWNLLTREQELQAQHIIWDKNSRQENGYMDNPKNNIGFIPFVQDAIPNGHRFYGYTVSENDPSLRIQIMVRPTLVARFCQIALINSFDNQKELSVLLKSKALHSLKGITKYSFKELINERILFLKTKSN